MNPVETNRFMSFTKENKGSSLPISQYSCFNPFDDFSQLLVHACLYCDSLGCLADTGWTHPKAQPDLRQRHSTVALA
jgi:hypothetical protein